METTPVLIVGGGPAGVVLGIELAKHKIHSVILEKDGEIEQDPRAATLVGDTVRIAYHLSLGPRMSRIGRPILPYYLHCRASTNSMLLARWRRRQARHSAEALPRETCRNPSRDWLVRLHRHMGSSQHPDEAAVT